MRLKCIIIAVYVLQLTIIIYVLNHTLFKNLKKHKNS